MGCCNNCDNGLGGCGDPMPCYATDPCLEMGIGGGTGPYVFSDWRDYVVTATGRPGLVLGDLEGDDEMYAASSGPLIVGPPNCPEDYWLEPLTGSCFPLPPGGAPSWDDVDPSDGLPWDPGWWSGESPIPPGGVDDGPRVGPPWCAPGYWLPELPDGQNFPNCVPLPPCVAGLPEGTPCSGGGPAPLPPGQPLPNPSGGPCPEGWWRDPVLMRCWPRCPTIHRSRAAADCRSPFRRASPRRPVSPTKKTERAGVRSSGSAS